MTSEFFGNDTVAQRSPKSCNRIGGYDLRQRKLNLGSADLFDTAALHTNYRKVQPPQQDPHMLYYLYIPVFVCLNITPACFRENIISTVKIRHLICLLFPLSWRGHTMGEQHILALFMSLVP